MTSENLHPGAADQLTIARILHTGVTAAPDQRIEGHDGSTITYRDLKNRVHRLGSVLASRGIGEGSTVAVMDWDTTRYLEAFFGVPMTGARLHMINIRLAPDQIAYTIDHAGDDLILVNAEFLPLLNQILPMLSRRLDILVMREKGDPDGGTEDLEPLMEAADPNHVFPDMDEETVATTFYTTGTTGLPKGVFFSHRQIVLHTLASLGALASGIHTSFRAGDVYMPMTPMFHVHAWGLPYVATMLGVRQSYPGRYNPAALLERISRHGITFTHCVPTILQMLLAEDANGALDGLKMIVGGAPMPEALAIRALGAGIDVCTGYGMSETCPILTLSRLDPGMDVTTRESASIRSRTGRPIPLVEVRLVDENMANAPDGGEVVARAPWLTAGYVADPENSATLWAGGWLHTGDVACWDERGYLRITDRIKDVIKTGGEWVSSLELEAHILAVASVQDVCVVAEPDPKWGERPAAFIVTASPDADAQIRDHLSSLVDDGQIPKYAVPTRIESIADIPRTSVGKPDKKALRARLNPSATPQTALLT